VNVRGNSSLAGQLERMEKARVARREHPALRDTHVTLSHGAGGKASQALIDAVIVPALASPLLDGYADAAILAPSRDERLAFTTDSYVVSPLFFPGGDIGKLAVNGTINDLACVGARPLYLSVGLILEEGLEIDTLRRLLRSIGDAANAAGVIVVAGDTKVVSRGHGDGVYVNSSGIGVVASNGNLSPANVRAGDVVVLSGYVGDHGMAVMLAREALEIDAEIVSDSAPLHDLAAAVLAAAPGTRVLKDPTRGGVATSLNEIARRAGVAIAVEEEHIPVRDEVRGACEILGIDPLHIANEGKLLAVVSAEDAEAALAAMRKHALGTDAAIIGRVLEAPEGMVLARTRVGGSRVLDMLVGDPLPRIC
jgi:hydrogenase expression/formation protein HypE